MAGLAAGCGRAPAPTLPADHWAEWKSLHLQPDGRVVDGGQAGISHSEAQGYGLLLAESAADREAFERILAWTDTRLRVRDDARAAWRWDPAAGAVTDANNATDGDLLVAWALVRAARRWDEDAWRAEARAILADVVRLLVVETPHGPVLLPGAEGFVHDGVPTVNLSYWVFPALEDFRKLDRSGPWRALERSGLRLLVRHRYGLANLPPDWLQLGERPRPAPAFPPRFGYEALRIPLYACWADAGAWGAMGAIHDFWNLRERPPAWVDLKTGETAEHPLGPGGLAVKAWLNECLGGPAPAAGAPGAADYYEHTLALLVEVARREATD